MRNPEAIQVGGQYEPELDLVRLERERKRAAHVVELLLQREQPARRVGATQLEIGAPRQAGEVLGVPKPKISLFVLLCQPLERVLANRLEHPEALV